MAKAKKPNPQDATRRNVQAANRKFRTIKNILDVQMTTNDQMMRRIMALERTIYALEKAARS